MAEQIQLTTLSLCVLNVMQKFMPTMIDIHEDASIDQKNYDNTKSNGWNCVRVLRQYSHPFQLEPMWGHSKR